MKNRFKWKSNKQKSRQNMITNTSRKKWAQQRVVDQEDEETSPDENRLAL